MNWYAKINAVDNGFVIDYFDGEIKKKVVYEEKENNDLMVNEIDKEHIIEIFYDLLEFFGVSGNKYDKKRIKITYEKQ